MHFFSLSILIVLPFFLAVIGALVYLLILAIKALRKYIRSGPVRAEKKAAALSLGEVIRRHRLDCHMTQEFVAESLGVSRQAVSKWESGASDPSTGNLTALARLFGVSAESMLKDINA